MVVLRHRVLGHGVVVRVGPDHANGVALQEKRSGGSYLMGRGSTCDRLVLWKGSRDVYRDKKRG